MPNAQVAFWVIVLLVALAIAFDFMNGFHDAANSIASVVSTGVLNPHQAVAMAALFNFVALFVFHLTVATTVGNGIVDQGIIDHYVVFGALIGGIVGASVAKAGTWALIPSGILKVVAVIFISPLIGFILGSLLLLAISWIFVRSTPSRVDRLFRRMQLFSSSLYGLGIPVSTTHTITGSIVGVGAAQNVSAVRWGIAGNLLWAWILTIPCSAFAAGVAWFMGRLLLSPAP